MSKKKSEKTLKWLKTSQRKIDLRVPLFVTQEMVDDVEALILKFSPNASNTRLMSAFITYPWKDPEADIVLNDVTVATPEEVLDMVLDSPDPEPDTFTDNSIAYQVEGEEGRTWREGDAELSEQDRRDLAAMHGEVVNQEKDPIAEFFERIDSLPEAEREKELEAFAFEYMNAKVVADINTPEPNQS